jgi:vacuolar-type H+-ATPase subunit E/Vma4
MALADLVSRLEQEAANQVAAIQQEADAAVMAIEAATERAVSDAAARHLEREHAVRQAAQQRELALARRQARARELESRHAQLARILEGARALIPEMAASAAYLDVLPVHVEEALAFLDGVRARVRCSAAVYPIVQPIVARHEGVELVADESVGPGIVAEAVDGSLVIDNTLGARLARADARLVIALTQQVDHAER